MNTEQIIYITPAGRAAFNMTGAQAGVTFERRKVSLPAPVWFVAGPDAPTGSGSPIGEIAQ